MKKIASTIASVFILMILSLFISSCEESPAKYISVDDMKRIVMNLSDDSFMGRKPFTEGERLSVEYIARELSDIGFEPAFDGSYYQEVPMIQITSKVNGSAKINVKGEELILNAPDQIAVSSPFPAEKIEIKNSKLVFCGFGIVAPEYGWNDYKDIDVKGKTVVVLINDPGLYSQDKSIFKGNEMTYYGRWTYKWEQAAKLGAQGILIIHDELGAGYGFNVPRNSSITSRLFIDNSDILKNSKLTGWLTAESATEIFSKMGYSIEDLRAISLKASFVPFETDASISVNIDNHIEKNSSKNVAGILRGGKSPEEAVIITAHWDHFGVGEKQSGDSIYNGAVDNGTTMAWAFEIGRVINKMRSKPDRSIILLFPTAEEQGLTGSYYYVANPVIPIEKTIACLNNDMLVPRGKMRDVTMIGYGYSTLDTLYEKFAADMDRYLLPDPNSHTGLFFRSDHFPFYKAGVPSIWAMGCFDSREHGKEWAQQSWDYFIKSVYHRPSDNYNQNWDWSGVVEDTELALRVVLWLSSSANPRPKLLN
jgi:Zn-dependent M28 family amino/carboxypeptidase